MLIDTKKVIHKLVGRFVTIMPNKIVPFVYEAKCYF